MPNGALDYISSGMSGIILNVYMVQGSICNADTHNIILNLSYIANLSLAPSQADVPCNESKDRGSGPPSAVLHSHGYCSCGQ
jgi:hypothetical protein